MFVKELIGEAMNCISSSDDVQNYLSGEADAAVKEKAKTVLFCINAVRDELARTWFPLRAQYTPPSGTADCELKNFDETPVKIIAVQKGGKSVRWRISGGVLHCGEADCTVEYDYTPAKLTEEDEFYFPEPAVGEYLVRCGALAEYFLLVGEVSLSAVWENKYRHEIDLIIARRSAAGRIPSRSWV